jgi:3-oxoacyl-[acyl-carrier-protein] synthase-1
MLAESFKKHFFSGPHKVSPYAVPQVMGSTVSAGLASNLGIRGANYSITSACSTSAHCIGHAADLIRWGKQDVVIAGGAEEASWPIAMFFDAMGALSTKFNENPKQASRPYDKKRDGFVLSGGAGMLVMEELDHARRRHTKIYGEVIGYGATSDGRDMVVATADGAARAMSQALETVDRPIEYINTHATSTIQGDIEEIKALHMVFGRKLPFFSSTKGLTGHAIGASGAHEAIFSLLMMRDSFLAGSVNIIDLDPVLKGLPLIRETKKMKVKTVMTNSFGFGGSNASLIFSAVE